MTLEDRTWMLRGNCLNMHPDVMFPDEDNPDALNEAKLVCRDCPVIGQCASWARRHRVGGGGVWAGARRRKAPEVREYDCGTMRGFGRHKRWGEQPCDACRDAERIRRIELREMNPERVRARKRNAYRNRKNRKEAA